MRYITLGKTGLEISRVALGTWAFGGEWGSFDREEAGEVIGRALDLGINFFDTAQAYGFGLSEGVLADGLWRRVRRDEVVVASKGGLRKEGDELLRDASAKWLRAGVESSLQALRTDYIDLYQVHWPDSSTPADETGQTLEALVREGKIRHAGVSNYSLAQMKELSAYGPLETLQPPYSMFRRDIEEEILPYTAANDIGVLIYGPLAHGLLSGRMSPDTAFAEGDWRTGSSDFKGERFRRNLAVVERLKAFARERGHSLPEIAVAWTLSHPAVHVALVGARRPSHLDGTVPAADIRLSAEDLEQIVDILVDAVPLKGPSPEGG